MSLLISIWSGMNYDNLLQMYHHYIRRKMLLRKRSDCVIYMQLRCEILNSSHLAFTTLYTSTDAEY